MDKIEEFRDALHGGCISQEPKGESQEASLGGMEDIYRAVLDATWMHVAWSGGSLLTYLLTYLLGPGGSAATDTWRKSVDLAPVAIAPASEAWPCVQTRYRDHTAAAESAS